jgi:hypothetical protein
MLILWYNLVFYEMKVGYKTWVLLKCMQYILLPFSILPLDLSFILISLNLQSSKHTSVGFIKNKKLDS